MSIGRCKKRKQVTHNACNFSLLLTMVIWLQTFPVNAEESSIMPKATLLSPSMPHQNFDPQGSYISNGANHDLNFASFFSYDNSVDWEVRFDPAVEIVSFFFLNDGTDGEKSSFGEGFF